MNTFKNLVLKFVIVFLVAVMFIFSYGVFWVWYQKSGFREKNQFSYKPQEWPGYLEVVKEAISREHTEIRITSREHAKTVVNPLPATSTNINAGREWYKLYCAVCHGQNGEGRGLMGSVPNLAPVPKEEDEELHAYLLEFINSPVKINLAYVGDTMKDGEIYYVITNGGESIMPAFKDAMPPKYRWQLINYIKWRFSNDFEGE